MLCHQKPLVAQRFDYKSTPCRYPRLHTIWHCSRSQSAPRGLMAVLAEGRQFAHAKHGFTDGTGLTIKDITSFTGGYTGFVLTRERQRLVSLIRRSESLPSPYPSSGPPSGSQHPKTLSAEWA